VTAESVTALGDVSGKVLVAGSHGVIAAFWAPARRRPHPQRRGVGRIAGIEPAYLEARSAAAGP
jgi:hypothetical protein